MKKLTCSLLVAGALSSCMAAQTVNEKSLLEALKGITYEGNLGFKYHNRKIKDGEKASQNEFNIRFGIHVPITEQINAVVSIEGNQPLGVNDTDDGVVKVNADIRNVYLEYFDKEFKLSIGQQPLNIPISDNGSQGYVGVGSRIDYKIDNTNLVAAYFTGADDLAGFPPTFSNPFLHGFRYNYDLPAEACTSSILFAGAESKFEYANTEVWAIRSPGFLSHMFVGLANGQVDNFNYAAQVINAKRSKTDETGTHYLVKLGYEMGPVHASIQHSKNDDKQGIYSLAGEDSSGLIKTGVRLGTMIDNVPGVKTYAGTLGMYVGESTDVKLYYGQADIDGTYGGKAIDDTLTEYGVSVEHIVSNKIFTGLYYSDIDSDENTIEQRYLGFMAVYEF